MGTVRDARLEHRLHVDWQYWPDTRTQANHPGDTIPDESESSHPDVENEALISWGLTQCANATGEGASIIVLHGNGTELQWERNVTDEQLERILEQPEPTNGRSLRMCFLNTLNCRRSWLPGNFNVRPETIRILRAAGLSPLILGNIFSENGYWAKLGNQSSCRYADNGKLLSFELCYHYRCGWDTGVSFTHLSRTQHRSTYFCINFPSDAFKRLERVVQNCPSIMYRDFFPETLSASDSLKQWQKAISDRRESLIRFVGIERQNDNERIDLTQDTVDLHRLARHWLTLGQDCTDFHIQLQFLQDAYMHYKKALTKRTAAWEFDKRVDMSESFKMLKSECDIIVRWTRGYQERTNIRINLLYHLVNQREARTNTAIASSTAKVAEQTQRDSASMITLAAVTMLFLPGTFVSAILSTSFFDYRDHGLHVSPKWWILVAATIPLMFVVFGIWLGWRHYRLRRKQPRN